MVNYGGVLVSCITGSEGRVALILQVDEMLVVQGEPLPVVLGQFPLGVERGLACGPGLLPGCRMLVVGNVEQVHGPAGQEPPSSNQAQTPPVLQRWFS